MVTVISEELHFHTSPDVYITHLFHYKLKNNLSKNIHQGGHKAEQSFLGIDYTKHTLFISLYRKDVLNTSLNHCLVPGDK